MRNLALGAVIGFAIAVLVLSVWRREPAEAVTAPVSPPPAGAGGAPVAPAIEPPAVDAPEAQELRLRGPNQAMKVQLPPGLQHRQILPLAPGVRLAQPPAPDAG